MEKREYTRRDSIIGFIVILLVFLIGVCVGKVW